MNQLPLKKILPALANITACFRFPQLAADITGAFGFLAEKLYFISTSHVFGSNTLASSWKPLRRAIQSMITIYAQRDDLVEKHKPLLDKLKWSEETTPTPKLTKVFPCEINYGVTDENENLRPMRTNIYVDNILAAPAR